MAYGQGFRRGGGFRRSFGGGFREKTKIKCSECGKEDEVPFKPREGTPVYCRDCFAKRKGFTPRPREDRKPQKEESEESEEETEEETEEEA